MKTQELIALMRFVIIAVLVFSFAIVVAFLVATGKVNINYTKSERDKVEINS